MGSENRRTQQLEEHIRKVVEAAPPLTPGQIDRLRLIFSQAPVDRAESAVPGSGLS